MSNALLWRPPTPADMKLALGLLCLAALAWPLATATTPTNAEPFESVPLQASANVLAYSVTAGSNVLIAQFTPPHVAVTLGNPVTWAHVAELHTITTADSLDDALDGRGNDFFDTDCQANGEPGEDGTGDTCHAFLAAGTFTHTFANPGAYWYFCAFHFRDGMVGAVEVL